MHENDDPPFVGGPQVNGVASLLTIELKPDLFCYSDDFACPDGGELAHRPISIG
jgi:hypothetical protein